MEPAKKSLWMWLFILPLACSGCAAVAGDDEEQESEPQGSSADELRSRVSCTEKAATGYKTTIGEHLARLAHFDSVEIGAVVGRGRGLPLSRPRRRADHRARGEEPTRRRRRSPVRLRRTIDDTRCSLVERVPAR